MRLSEILRLVWLNLSQNKFKVVLTSVGIVVGSATIMMVIAIGSGGKRDVADQFKNLNAGAIDISYESSGYGDFEDFGPGQGGMPGGGEMPGGGGMPGGGMPGGRMSGTRNRSGGMSMGGGFPFGGGNSSFKEQNGVVLSSEDAEDLKVFVPGVEDATISYTTNSEVEGGTLEDASNYTIAGVEENYASMSNLDLADGFFLMEEDNISKRKICVLGYQTAKEIFGQSADVVGDVIYIDSRPYTIAGVLSEMGNVVSGISPDTTIFIPYDTGIKYLTGDNISPTITIIAQDVDEVETMMGNVEMVLADSYPNAQFTISDAGSKMEAALSSNRTLTMLLLAMAAIVFLVGGVGIMNVLFVSVKERTNEIGILKALGASRTDILLEFLLEASSISLLGAFLGVALGLGITPVVERLGMTVLLSNEAALIAILFGVITGSAFGFYPAYRASRMIPVQALNAE